MKILDVSPMGVYPPVIGGHRRIHNLNVEISKYHEIFLFSQGIRHFELKFPLKSWITRINDNYIEYRFVSYVDLSMRYLLSLVSKYFSTIYSDQILKLYDPKILRNMIRECDVIKVELPWQFSYVFNKKPKDTPIILVEHNVEFELFNQLMNFNNDFTLFKFIKKFKNLKKLLVNVAIEKERFAVENADIIFTVCEEDREKLRKYYGVNKSKIYVIPNGVDTSKFYPIPLEDKERLKKNMGFEGKKIILFSGSRYFPNEEAVHKIIEFSEKLKNRKDIIFLIIGTVGTLFKDKNKYPNIIFTGYVNDVIKYFQIADIAINPMLSGSGTNIKMLEYMASGLPIITTKIGARGLDLKHSKHVIISEIDEFHEWIETLLEDKDLRDKLSINGRKLVEEKYDWKKIAEKELKILEKIVKI